MPIKVDGTNGLLQSYDFQTPVTGFSYTFPTGIQTVILAPAATLASGTVTMPAVPTDGMVVTIESTQQITALNIAANSGQSIVGGSVTFRANQPLSYIYRSSNTTWYPFSGAANSDIVSGTAVASTSGTSIDFTGIPSWVKRITVMLRGVSLSGSANCLIQLGTGGTPTTSGYTGAFGVMTTAPAYAVSALSTGFTVQEQSAASAVDSYLMFANITGNTWVGTGGFSDTAGARSGFITGSVALSGVLNLVRITTSNGTDTFDAGSINILYE